MEILISINKHKQSHYKINYKKEMQPLSRADLLFFAGMIMVNF